VPDTLFDGAKLSFVSLPQGKKHPDTNEKLVLRPFSIAAGEKRQEHETNIDQQTLAGFQLAMQQFQAQGCRRCPCCRPIDGLHFMGRRPRRQKNKKRQQQTEGEAMGW